MEYEDVICVFFFQAEDGIRDYKVTGVQTCALPISRLLYWPFLAAAAPLIFILTSSAINHYCPDLLAAAPPLFILPTYRCGSAPAFNTDHFSLRQRPRFLYWPAAPSIIYCPDLLAAAPPIFILPISCCGSAPAFYTDQFSLWQRPRHLVFTDLIEYIDIGCKQLAPIQTNDHCAISLPTVNRKKLSRYETIQKHQVRSEEHTSELQSPCNLVCRLLLEKKKKIIMKP